MAETSIAVRLGLTGLASTQAGLKRFFGLIDKEGRAATVGVGSLTAGLKNIALAAAGAASAYSRSGALPTASATSPSWW
jgi:hypothetical protein